jgi:hypothetical protein
MASRNCPDWVADGTEQGHCDYDGLPCDGCGGEFDLGDILCPEAEDWEEDDSEVVG